MTQIKGTFEGCGEAPAPLKLNEVFISHADGTLNTARSRAVTVNVPLRAFSACLASPLCLKETKGWSFHAIFHALHPLPLSISHTWFSPSPFTISCICPISHRCPPTPHHQAPFPVFRAGENLYCGFSLDLEATRQG